MLSRTKVKSRVSRKTNPEIEETLRLALKHSKWAQIARIISSSTRKYSSVNLHQIDEKVKDGDSVIIVGKILSQGSLSKKVKIVALSISGAAKERLKESKSEFVHIKSEIAKNPKFEGLKLLR